MDESRFVKIGQQVVNLAAIASAHWEGEKLWVHSNGGRFTSITGKRAELLWSVLEGIALDLESGTVPGGPKR
jgi:hypothetical protein